MNNKSTLSRTILNSLHTSLMFPLSIEAKEAEKGLVNIQRQWNLAVVELVEDSNKSGVEINREQFPGSPL